MNPGGDDPHGEDVEIAESMAHELGPEVMGLLGDAEVTEVYRNSDGTLWVDSFAGVSCALEHFPADRALRFLKLAAARINATLTAEEPDVACSLPRHRFAGARLQGEIPPTVDTPGFNIRKLPTRVFTLPEYVERGIMTVDHFQAIRFAVANGYSIIVAGPTNSGKSTLTNGVIAELARTATGRDRVVVLEDTPEVLCQVPNVHTMRTSKRRDLRALVRIAMRKSPRWLVVGEMRGVEAVDVLEGWASGHPGIATMHASRPEAVVLRLERWLGRGGDPDPKRLVAEAVKLVVMVQLGADGRRRVTDVVELDGMEGDRYRWCRSTGGSPTARETV